MKSIEPITIWKNGESQEANLLNAYIINDNLATSCSFYYSLCSSGEGTESMPLVVGQTLAEGNIAMQSGVGGSGQLRTLNISVSNAATYNVTAFAAIVDM